MAEKLNLALLVQPESEFGTRKLVARVVAMQPDGQLYNAPSWDWRGTGGAEFDGLEIAAYLGELNSDGGGTRGGRLWGFTCTYRVHHIEKAEHARAIGSVLAKIGRHLDRANSEDGYLSESDFHGYVMRVAAALKIRTLYVRNTTRAKDMSGELYRKVNGSALQSYVSLVTEHAEKGELSDIGLDRTRY